VTFAKEGPYSLVIRARTWASPNLVTHVIRRGMREQGVCVGGGGGGDWVDVQKSRGQGETYCSADAASIEGDGRRDSDSGGVGVMACDARQGRAKPLLPSWAYAGGQTAVR